MTKTETKKEESVDSTPKMENLSEVVDSIPKPENLNEMIDLTPKPEKLTENQLARLQATIKTIDQLTQQVGETEVRKYGLIKAMETVQQRVQALRQEFIKEYGTDNINIQDGTIAYPEEIKLQTQKKTQLKLHKRMAKLIRKISVGKDYKNDAMHYAVGQEVYGGHTICDIIEEKDKFSVYIRKDKDVLPWKDFNKNMAVSVEYNLEY